MSPVFVELLNFTSTILVELIRLAAELAWPMAFAAFFYFYRKEMRIILHGLERLNIGAVSLNFSPATKTGVIRVVTRSLEEQLASRPDITSEDMQNIIQKVSSDIDGIDEQELTVIRFLRDIEDEEASRVDTYLALKKEFKDDYKGFEATLQRMHAKKLLRIDGGRVALRR